MGREASLGRVLGIAGMTGRAGAAGLDAFGTTGVVSPGAGIDEGCTEDGVVGLVDDSACSDVGWLVEGVSGRGTDVSDGIASSISVLAACRMFGSSTGSADSSVECFFLLRTRLAGKGSSGLESQGNCVVLASLFDQFL